MMSATCLIHITFMSLFVMINGQTVHQPLPSLLLSEGDPLHINCTFTVSGSPYLYWYIHHHNKSPVMLLYNYGTRENRGFTAKHEKESNAYHLTKHKVELSDSGVYYCAVRSTGYRFIFGSGTRLVIKPKTERTIPSVYKLKSSSLSEGLPSSVCLITDFPSPNKTLQINGKDVDLNDMAVLDESSDNKWRYSTVTWDTNDDDACNGNYDENDLVAEYEAENTDETCSSISIDESFRTNPSLNTLSLTVLGLRVLTAKAIVFNLIITLRLWSS